MKSKASIKGHPIHPILVSFPIAFFTGTFISDLIFYFAGNPFFGQMAKYLEAGGVISALLAAIPGLIDYFSRIPPDSSAMKRATRHGLLNISMLLIFTMALLMRRNNDISFFVILFFEGLGVIILSVSGWLGGTLVHRNQIGIDHRYAGATKWSEEVVEIATGNTVELNGLDKLKVNQMKLIHVNNKRIVIARTESELVAFEDRCTHRGGSLADGVMICGTVQCPWHGSQFNVKTGSVNVGPAREKIQVYQITSENQKHYLKL